MPTRSFWVWLHRWAGLAMAGFLIIVGLTGSVLAFREEIDTWLNPDLLTVAKRDAPMLDPIALRDRAAALHPGGLIDTVPLRSEPDRAVAFTHAPGVGHFMSAYIQFYLDPYTGEQLGQRPIWSGPSLARQNIVSFLYRLHFSLSLPWSMGGLGGYILGVTALVWTIDCFISFYLTLPLAHGKGGETRTNRKSWLQRWKPAWLIKWSGGFYRINFDVHRAFGLWTWAMLFVFAWSSVAFNLSEVYRPVMGLAFDMRSASDAPPVLDAPLDQPALSWGDALTRGRALMAETAARRGFRVLREESLDLDREHGVYLMSVASSWDVSREGATILVFDANTGEFKGQRGVGAEGVGQTITLWLVWLHMAQVFGMLMKIFVCLMGLVIAALSVTGVYIWWKKRKARVHHAGRSALRVAAVRKREFEQSRPN
jgi:uncharacterized iron-regulated membrane protein